MAGDKSFVENREFKETYVLDGSVLGNMSPQLVVPQFPLVRGQYQTLVSSDLSETWKNNFLAAFVTALLNFICKLTVYHYIAEDKTSKPEIWEIMLVVVTFLGYILCVVIYNFCPSDKKNLKKMIENRIGKY